MDVHALLDLILPRRCACCGEPGHAVCARCRRLLPRLEGPLCVRCGAPTAWPVERCRECAGRRLAFGRARAAVVYDDAVRRLIAAWKERGLRRIAEVAAEEIVSVLAPPEVDAISFVPPDRDRTLARGYHPAFRLARSLAESWQLPVVDLLWRTRPAARQRGLGLVERRRNVSDAFAARGRGPPRILLVDDVYTSGATVNAAASALRKGGARRVEVVTFARAVRC